MATIVEPERKYYHSTYENTTYPPRYHDPREHIFEMTDELSKFDKALLLLVNLFGALWFAIQGAIWLALAPYYFHPFRSDLLYSEDINNVAFTQYILIGRWRLIHILIFCTFFAAFYHFLNILLWSAYKRAIERRCNYWKYLAYFFIVPPLAVVLAWSNGAFIVFTLILLYGVVASEMLLGLALERANCGRLREEFDTVPAWLAFIPWIFAWGVISAYFWHNVADFDSLPNYLWIPYFFLLVASFWAKLLAVFAYNNHSKHQRTGLNPARRFVISKYVWYEIILYLLVLFSVTTLGWALYGGLRNEADEFIVTNRFE